MNSSTLRLSLSLATVAILGGCAVTSPPIAKEEVASRVLQDRAKMFQNQEPITAPISLDEAIARAVKYNLDNRLKMMEVAFQAGVADLSRWDMLPKLVASAGYSRRNNDLASQSFSINNANGVKTEPSGTTYTGSTERGHGSYGLEFSWNLLDFGVSYYRAKQQADQVMIAQERRRRVTQNLVSDVTTAYWRGLGAQRLVSQLDDTMKKANVALARARQIEQQGLMPQGQALAYQRALLDATTSLAFRRQELELAKLELSTLMNIPPISDYQLAEAAEPKLPDSPKDIAKLEDLALNQRPELREEDYKKRVSAAEVKKQFWSVLPGINLNLGIQGDTNNYLLNNNWAEGGVRLGWNLLKLATLPAQSRINEAQGKVDEARRMAQAAAIMTQVRIAASRYRLAQMELTQQDESARVDQRLLQYARSAQQARVDSELEVVRNEARSLLSAYQRHVSYANAQSAYARLTNSVGLDIPDLDADLPLPALTAQVAKASSAWLKGLE